MDASRRQSWIPAALLVGAIYFLVGRVFALPVSHLRMWRLVAWAISGGAFAAHIGYEHFRLRSSSRKTAWHVAVAVAIGAFGLAVAGMIRSVPTGSGTRPLWLLALVVWPAITAVPAYLVAWIAASVLARYPGNPDAGARGGL
jgi:hypothetical protein